MIAHLSRLIIVAKQLIIAPLILMLVNGAAMVVLVALTRKDPAEAPVATASAIIAVAVHAGVILTTAVVAAIIFTSVVLNGRFESIERTE